MGKKTIFGRCNLCFKDKDLIRAHIIPNWSSRLSGKSGEFLFCETNIQSLREASDKNPQGPIAENLFCQECDQKFGYGEDTLRQMIHPNDHKPRYVGKVDNYFLKIENQERIEQLYSAIGGLVFKAHCAEQDHWKKFILTKKQYRFLYKAISNNILSQYLDVGIYKIYNLENYKIGNFTDKIDISKILPFDIQTQYQPSISGSGIFSAKFIFGGLLLSTTFHMNGFRNENLHKDSLTLPVFPIDIRYLIDQNELFGLKNFTELFTVNEHLRMMKVLKRLPLESQCPCRVFYSKDEKKENLLFGECCYKYWFSHDM